MNSSRSGYGASHPVAGTRGQHDSAERPGHGAQPADRSRGRGWPMAMAAILAITVGVNLFVFRLASSDPSFAVEPSYYQQAVHWDDELAQRSQNAALGWQAAARLVESDDGVARVRVSLTDADGEPLDGADVRLEAFAISRALQVVRLPLPEADEASGGVYSAVLPAGALGQWELRLAIEHDNQRFTSVSRVERFR